MRRKGHEMNQGEETSTEAKRREEDQKGREERGEENRTDKRNDNEMIITCEVELSPQLCTDPIRFVLKENLLIPQQSKHEILTQDRDSSEPKSRAEQREAELHQGNDKHGCY